MKSVSYRLLSYQCQLTIISHMDANQRIHFSLQCPTILSMEKSIPFQIASLVLRPLELELNGYMYELDYLRRNHVTKESQLMNNKQEELQDLLLKCLTFTPEELLDVGMRRECVAYSDYLVLYECGKVKEYLDYTLSSWDAMEHLINKIFNGRGSVKIGHLVIDDQGMSQPILDALPVDVKLEINFLEKSTTPRSQLTDPMLPYAKRVRQVRKPRIIFNPRQLDMLERKFDETRFLSLSDRAELAAELGVTQAQVKIWFQSRRETLKLLKEGTSDTAWDEDDDS